MYEFIKVDYHVLYKKNRTSVINGYRSDDIKFEMISKDGHSIILKGQIKIIDNNKERPYTRAVLKKYNRSRDYQKATRANEESNA